MPADGERSEPCPECGRRFPDMHRLVDHLSDAHDAYSWTTEGRPMLATDGGEA